MGPSHEKRFTLLHANPCCRLCIRKELQVCVGEGKAMHCPCRVGTSRGATKCATTELHAQELQLALFGEQGVREAAGEILGETEEELHWPKARVVPSRKNKKSRSFSGDNS